MSAGIMDMHRYAHVKLHLTVLVYKPKGFKISVVFFDVKSGMEVYVSPSTWYTEAEVWLFQR